MYKRYLGADPPLPFCTSKINKDKIKRKCLLIVYILQLLMIKVHCASHFYIMQMHCILCIKNYKIVKKIVIKTQPNTK